MARILTRNTFDPLDTMLSRLGVVQHRRQTSSPQKGLQNLLDVLEDGLPAIVWADAVSLPYNNNLGIGEDMWAMLPIVVYGYDEANDSVHIADRAQVPLIVTKEVLADARARVKKEKFRVLTLDPPDPEKLVTAVQMGIWDCIKLYTEAPPKGSKNNFGLRAYRWWHKLLTRPKARMSWDREFPPGQKMYAGLTSAFFDINIFGKHGYAERDVFADFLDEAGIVLDKPALKDIAQQFRHSAEAWETLSLALLPDDIPPFGETRELMLRRRDCFHRQGNAALDEIKLIDGRLERLKEAVAADFPLDEASAVAMRENIATHVMRIHDIEQEAVAGLQAVMR